MCFDRRRQIYTAYDKPNSNRPFDKLTHMKKHNVN